MLDRLGVTLDEKVRGAHSGIARLRDGFACEIAACDDRECLRRQEALVLDAPGDEVAGHGQGTDVGEALVPGGVAEDIRVALEGSRSLWVGGASLGLVGHPVPSSCSEILDLVGAMGHDVVVGASVVRPLRHGLRWYDLIPNMPPDRLCILLEIYEDVLAEHEQVNQNPGVIWDEGNSQGGKMSNYSKKKKKELDL